MEYHALKFEDVRKFAAETDLFGQRESLLEQLAQHNYDQALTTSSMVVTEYFQAYRADDLSGRQVLQIPLYRRLVQLELMIMILAMQDQSLHVAAEMAA